MNKLSVQIDKVKLTYIKDKNTIILLNDNVTWRKYSRMWGDKMHRICSYVAMFPPTFANYFIENYSNENEIVLDTFSGRGTTLLEARALNRKAYAIDLNPFAYVLSRSKSISFNIEDVISRIYEWETNFNNSLEKFKLDKKMRVYYSKRNLIQISFIKEIYGRRWESLDDIDNFILAITLGLMHGPVKKDGSSIYFSISMSNCISMSRNYVKKYAKNKRLKLPKDNIFSKIRFRATDFLTKTKLTENKNIAKVYYGNALDISSYFGDIKPKLIFTSPPYLNIINYTQQNWIKMWLLGYENISDNKKICLDDRHGIETYKEFMFQYISSIQKIMDKETTLALVIGDVQKTDKIYSFDKMWSEDISKNIPNIKLEKIYEDNIAQNKKATNSMGDRAGKATRVDKVYIFKKI